MKANYGGIEPCSCSDYPGHASTVVFLRGCSQGCPWCHNAAIQAGQDLREIEEIYHKIDNSMPFISAVVVSGGEPSEQPEAAMAIADYAHSKGLKAGLHTSGRPMAGFAAISDHFDFILMGGPGYDPREVTA